MKTLKGIGILLLVLFLAGCAGQQNIDELKTRLSTFEESLARETLRTNELEFKVDSLSNEVQSLKGPVVSEMPKMTTEEIRKIQTALNKAGFDAGKVDGKLGPKTTQAIKNFQEANGIKGEGIVDIETWEKLQGYLNAIN
jgi:peptidoglycan hydrolase-like protein with peptidoglycan-binding domain